MANLQRDPTVLHRLLDVAVSHRLGLSRAEKPRELEGTFWSCGCWLVRVAGQMQALIAAATLADENPHWAYPTACSDKNLILSVQAMGHPLLSDKQRVSNDLSLERARPLLLVTGSNMAGKSTLLRSLGLNQILARTGSPVCAQQFQSPLFDLATSICVRDSLKEGVSFFMAELKR